MTYHNFEQEVMTKITDMLPDGYKANIRPIAKNNGITLHGLTINNGLSNISPTIYLDYYYDEYNEGSDIDSLIDAIMDQYNKYAIDHDFDVTIFTDYEKCKHNISYKLINYEKNKKLLNDVPHIVYLDLAIVFYCLLNCKDFETSSILIRNSHMKLWDVTVEELFDVASVNTPKLLKYDIKNLSDIVKDIVNRSDMKGEEFSDIMGIQSDEIADSPMYVLTNKIKLYGACTILYKNLLEEFARKLKTDLYIIPSSVHEVLLVPKNSDCDYDYLDELIKEVNSSELLPEEILSDHVYLYSRLDDAITY